MVTKPQGIVTRSNSDKVQSMMVGAKAWCRRSIGAKSFFLRRQIFKVPHNNALKLTAPPVHAFCSSRVLKILGRGAKKRAPRPAA